MPSTVRSCAFVLAFVISLATLRLRAEDWFQFRGPDGQGHSSATALPVHWGKNENVRWKTPIPGKGWSSPITFGNRIFLTTAVPEGDNYSLHALGLDARSGKILWDTVVYDKLRAGAERIHGKNSHASPTPVTDGEHVFVHFGTHGTACLTIDGKILWKTRALEYAPNHGSGGSPVLVDGQVVVNCDGADVQYVVAINAATGKISWKKERPHCSEAKRFSFATPLVIDVHGQKQIVSPGAHCVVAYDPNSGDEIWSSRYQGYSVVPRPVYGHGMVYLSTSFDAAILFAIRTDGHGDVTESHVAWKESRSIPSTPSALLIGENLFLVNDQGIASCRDAETGHQQWMHRIGGKFSASPLFADGKIYLQSEGGETTVLRPMRQEYSEVARNNLAEATLATPAVIESALLIRTASALYRIENR